MKILYNSDHTIFVQIAPACGPNTYQIIYGETLDFECHYQQWQHKIPGRKINFWSKFAVKNFHATVANTDIRSLKSLHTFLKECLYHMLVKFEQNRMVQTTRNFELFDKKTGFLKPFFTKRWRHFGRCFCS